MINMNVLSVANGEVFIVAEAGVNHNGSVKEALKLVDAAVEAGCNAVKFQTWVTEMVYSKDKSLKPEYQIKSTGSKESEFETVKQLELSREDFVAIKDYCDRKGIVFFSTPDEEESASALLKMGVNMFKTASQDVTNIPFLKYIAKLGLPVLFSTGACTMSEVAQGVEAILAENANLIIFHCVSSYPAPADQMNLSVIPVLRNCFGCEVGLSDHSLGAEVACAAVGLGVRVFEKHLTLDKVGRGPDHRASLSPPEMRSYCKMLRNARSALGDGIKRIMPCESENRTAFRRFLVASRNIQIGETISKTDIYFKKVVSGIAPRFCDMVIGCEVVKDIEEDSVLEWSMLRHK